MKADISIPEQERKSISDKLNALLADTFTLYLQTHNYHWNVTGPWFRSLHLLFEEQYTEMWSAIDEIAERIRILGAWAPGTYAEFTKLTGIAPDANPRRSEDMLRALVANHEALIRSARAILPVAEQGNDQGTLDLLSQRIQFHEKAAWMLRSSLD